MMLRCLLPVGGGETGEDGVSVTESQTAAVAAAAAVGGGRLAQPVSPAVGYYLLPGYQSAYSSGTYISHLCRLMPG